MNEGFLPFLNDAEFSLGAIDEPDENTTISVYTSVGEITGNAIDIDQFSGATFVMVFSWSDFNREVIEELAAEEGIPVEEIEQEVNLDEKVCVLENVIPLREVWNIEQDTDGVLI